MTIATPLTEILELARWAPSGDNTQPWHFEVRDDHRVVVHASDTREHCVYDLDGHSSQLAHGTLLETMAIAASAHGLRMEFRRRADTPDSSPDYEVELISDSSVMPDPLLASISQRSVQRRAMRTEPLTASQKLALQGAIGNAYTVLWFEGGASRWHVAKLMFDNAKLRLTLPEAYPVHRDIIEWDARFSEDKVPDQALGVDVMTRKLMRWVMTSWSRVRFFNTYLAGHLAPRIEMDLLPGVFCAAHFVIVAAGAPKTIDDYVAAGRALQRFWLTATSLGLQLQPEMTPLIFSRYVRDGRAFSAQSGAIQFATKLSGRFSELLPHRSMERAVFLGRIGNGRPPGSRSLRLPLERLIRAK